MADYLGDPTARLSGRKSLNPFVHLDPIGTILPIFLILTGWRIIFGWGKPVPIDPFNLRNPRRDAALISLAGPGANLIFATLLAIFIRLGLFFLGPTAFIFEVIRFLSQIIALNIMWAVFNLLPVHPLDGGKVLIGLLPQELAVKWDEILHQYGLIILILLIFPFPFNGAAPISLILTPIVSLILSILLPGTPLV